MAAVGHSMCLSGPYSACGVRIERVFTGIPHRLYDHIGKTAMVPASRRHRLQLLLHAFGVDERLADLTR